MSASEKTMKESASSESRGRFRFKSGDSYYVSELGLRVR